MLILSKSVSECDEKEDGSSGEMREREGEREGRREGEEKGREGERESKRRQERGKERKMLLLCSRYRRMGVIGAVMIIQQLAMKGTSMDVSLRPSASQGQHDSTLPPARRRQVRNNSPERQFKSLCLTGYLNVG